MQCFPFPLTRDFPWLPWLSGYQGDCLVNYISQFPQNSDMHSSGPKNLCIFRFLRWSWDWPCGRESSLPVHILQFTQSRRIGKEVAIKEWVTKLSLCPLLPVLQHLISEEELYILWGSFSGWHQFLTAWNLIHWYQASDYWNVFPYV